MEAKKRPPGWYVLRGRRPAPAAPVPTTVTPAVTGVPRATPMGWGEQLYWRLYPLWLCTVWEAEINLREARAEIGKAIREAPPVVWAAERMPDAFG